MEALRYARLNTQALEARLRHFPEDAERLDLALGISIEARILNRRGELRPAAERFRRAIDLREDYLARNPTDVLTRRSLMITHAIQSGVVAAAVHKGRSCQLTMDS